jgi:hypothetical protein
METLQYDPESSFTTEPLHYQPHPHPYLLSCQPTNNLYQYSSSPLSHVTRNSLVAEISNTLNEITVSSDSPQTTTPAPTSSKSRLSRVRRNLSLSMDNWSPPPSPSTLSYTLTIHPTHPTLDPSISHPKSSLTTSVFPESMADDVQVVDRPVKEKQSPCKSPKRTRGKDAKEVYLPSSFSVHF